MWTPTPFRSGRFHDVGPTTRTPTLKHTARNHGWHFPLILLVAVIALGAGLGLRDPSPPDEPRFVLAARQMVESGEWLIPHRGSELYAHKPATFMWLQAAAYRVVGSWRIAFLLPSLLAALATLWLVHDLARRFWNRRVGVYAAAALLCCLQFGLQAKRGQIDMVLVFWTTLSLWALCRTLLLAPRRGLSALGGFAAGLGTVTKGVGFLPLLVLVPWAFVRRRTWHNTPDASTHWPWLVLGFALGTAVWLAPVLWAVATRSEPALRQYASEILFTQTGTRYLHAWHHLQPPWYYLRVIATMWLPGVLLLPWLAPAWWRRIRRGEPRTVVLVGWAVLVVLFFSASPGKREVYVFPALPALCIAAAPLLPGLLRRRGVRIALLGYVVAVSAVLLATGVAGLTSAAWVTEAAAARALPAATTHALAGWALALGIAGLALAAWGRLARAGTVALGFNLLLWTIHGLGFAVALDANSSGRDIMQRTRARIGPIAELGLVGWREQHLLQATGPTREFGFERALEGQWRDAVTWAAQAPGERWLFVLDAQVPACVDRGRAIGLGRSSRRDWLLLPGPAVAACVPRDAGR